MAFPKRMSSKMILDVALLVLVPSLVTGYEVMLGHTYRYILIPGL